LSLSLSCFANNTDGGFMSKIRLVLLSGVAVFAFTAFSASAAFGAAKFEWSVNGTPLAAGVKLTILLKPDATNGTIILKGTAFGVATELETHTFKSESNIQGGKPGTGEGVTTFESITVTKPKNCTAANVKTENLKSSIVESTGGKALILLSPIGTTVFATYSYGGASCSLTGDSVNVTGSVLLEPLSTASQELQLFTFLPSGLKSTSSTGTVSTNTLELAGSGKTASATISGNVEALLDVALPFSPL
jgi:hypothetical protein